MKDIGYYNGTIGNLDEMTVPMNDRAGYFGDGIYETALVPQDNFPDLDKHIDRFFRGAAAISMTVPFEKKELKYLKKIIKDKFINRIEKDINPRYKMSYTPLESNDKDGYNLNMQLDYGILNKDEKNSEVYRYILDIDSYVRDIDKINDLKKVSSEILQLKNKDFEIYVGELQEKFLDVMISRNSKSEFDENIKKFGIIHGVNYGKQL